MQPRGTLSAKAISKSYGANVVLDDISLAVPPRARIGVVGANGSGKTTLLRVLAGLEAPDAGSVVRRPPSLTVGYLPQHGSVADAETAEWKLRKTAAAAGIELVQRAWEGLSGGERAKAKLVTLLAGHYDVLLLDEPTNDLDFAGLAALERFVTETESALLVVSHDRAFLEHSVDRIVEFEAETRRVREFAGGWAEYERLRELGRRREAAAYSRYVEERDRFDGLLRARRGEARSAGRMSDRRRTHALMSNVRVAEKRLARLERVEKPWEPWRLHLSLDRSRRSGDVIVRLERAVVALGEFRVGPVDLELRQGDRLAIAGANGSGKTTLLRALLGELPLAAGTRFVGPSVRIGALEQRRSAFDVREPLLELFCERSGLAQLEARTLLAKFALGADDVLRPASTLSPGERTRADLALLAAQGVNALVLDEPTNHLDLEAIEELELALGGYDGTIVLVTHDRRLLAAFEPTATLSL